MTTSKKIINWILNWIKKLVKKFLPPKPLLVTEDDLISPGLWINLTIYQTVFQYFHPYEIFLHQRKIYVQSSSYVKRGFFKLSSVLLITFVALSFLLILWKLLRGRIGIGNSDIDTLRLIALLYATFVIPMFIQASVTKGFRPELICQVVNPIVEFGRQIKGK